MNSLDPSLSKYLSSSKQDIYDEYHGSRKKTKKRKLESTGLLIAGEDGDGAGADSWNPWTATERKMNGGSLVYGDDENEKDRMPVVEHRTTSIFKPVAGSSKSKGRATQPAEDEAIPADEAPLVIGSVIEEAPRASSSKPSTSRLQGGLQTAAQLREEGARRRAAAEAEKEAARAKAAAAGEDQQEETVYRDRSGKKIDTKAEKADLQRKKREELEREMQKMEWGKGLVQREDRERRQRELQDMAGRDVARYADDEDMNNEMKEVQRWNDPAARFLSGDGSSKKKNKGPTRPKYNGPMPAPNRFGILPGYRWDGVDRSNGFEGELMQAGNKRKVQEAAARVYSTEDM